MAGRGLSPLKLFVYRFFPPVEYSRRGLSFCYTFSLLDILQTWIQTLSHHVIDYRLRNLGHNDLVVAPHYLHRNGFFSRLSRAF